MSQKKLKVLAGLGNPGQSYAKHRHNVGYWLLDRLIQKHQLTGKEKPGYVVYPWQHDHGVTYLVRAKSYMNECGQGIGELMNFFKVDPSDLWVAYDDMDFLPGQVRVRKSGGAGGHNGIKSVIQHLGPDFYRLRFGVGRPERREQVKSYVLTQPSVQDQEHIDRVVTFVSDNLDLLLAGKYDEFTEKTHVETK